MGRVGGSAGWAKWPTFSKQKVGLGYFGMLRGVLGGVGGCKDHSKDIWECFPFNLISRDILGSLRKGFRAEL